jgi:hypothetical protein
MKHHVADVISAAREEYLRIRFWGVVALIAGLAGVTVANFV